MATQRQPLGSQELLTASLHSANSQDTQLWTNESSHDGTAEYDDPPRPFAPSPVSRNEREGHAYQPVPSTIEPSTIQRDDHLYPPEASPEPTKEQELAQCPTGGHHPRYGWAAEIACVVFSILCIIAIIIILSRTDGRLLSSWTIAILPNAVIAILSTAAKAAMIFPVAESISQLKWLKLTRTGSGLQDLQWFDNASRGPWGSLKLFWHARGSPFPAYLGCLVMTAAIAIDPFTQQILSFEQRATVVDGPQSSVTRSQVYDNGGKGVSGAGAVLQPTRDGLFQAAAVSGVYDLVSQPPFKCPGSNCTYPDFTSLGICSKCSDVTAKTTKSCDSVEGGWQIQACNFTTPGGFSPQASAGSDAHNGFGYTLLNVSVKVPDPNQPQHLVSMAMIRFADDARATETQWQDTLTAYECNYDACAKAYFWGPVIPFTTLERGFPGNTTYEINLFDLRVMVKALSEVYNPGSPGSDSFAAALYNSPNLTRTVENIATGMSYRMLSGPNATAVTGEVFAVQTYMRNTGPGYRWRRRSKY